MERPVDHFLKAHQRRPTSNGSNATFTFMIGNCSVIASAVEHLVERVAVAELKGGEGCKLVILDGQESKLI